MLYWWNLPQFFIFKTLLSRKVYLPRKAVFRKLTWIMQHYEAFQLAVNSGRKSKGRQREWPRNFMEMGHNNAFAIIFAIFYAAFRFVTYFWSYKEMHYWSELYENLSSFWWVVHNGTKLVASLPPCLLISTSTLPYSLLQL